MKNIYTQLSHNFLLCAGITMALSVSAGPITVRNESGKPRWVGIFYTKNHHTAIVPDKNGKFSEIVKIPKNGGHTFQQLEAQRIKGLDRDIIAFFKAPKSDNKLKDLITYSVDDNVNTMGKSNKNAIVEYQPDIDGDYLNVGTLQFVSEAIITDSKIIKA